MKPQLVHIITQCCVVHSGDVMDWLWCSAPSPEDLTVSLSWESPRSTNPSPYLHSNSWPTVIFSLSPLFCLFQWSTYLKSYGCRLSPPRLLGVFKVCINFFYVFHGLIAHFFSVPNSVLLSEVALFNQAFTDFSSCLDMESRLLRC